MKFWLVNQLTNNDLIFAEKNVLNLTLTNPTDYAHFGEEVENSDIKRSIIAFGPCKPVIEFPKNNDGRKFSSNFYFVSARSGSKIPRSWLCYSTVLDRAYCESCWLFANRKSTSFKSEWINGINDWKHLSQSIQRHEISTQHLESTNMRIIWMKNRTIDKELEIQYSKEATFWRNILLRLIKIILSLTAGNTALREHRGKIGSLEKCSEGNFLRTVNLLAEFDPILNNLVSNPKHKIKYLSPLIQNELIEILANKVREIICDDIRKSCGFSIILDSTQDIKKVDQVSIIIRYVLVNYEIKKIEIKESFLGFFVLDKHHAVDYANLLRQTLLTFGLSINKCFGQGYDGAAVMSGQHSGVQTLIRSDFPNAVYVHCCAHNLNLVISDAAKSSSKVQTFFNIVQDVYNFFSVSAPRWALLALGKEVESKIQKKTLKKVCPTRWEARHDSVFALKERYFDIIKALTHILLTSHKSDEKNLGGSLKKKLESAEFVLILSFWERILRSLNVVSKTLQLINFNIEFAVIQLDSAIEDLTNLRANYNNIVEDAKNLCVLWKIPFNFNCKRDRFAVRYHEEVDCDRRLSITEDNFKVKVFYPTLDMALFQLKERFKGLKTINDEFSFLKPINLTTIEEQIIIKASYDLHIKYKNELSSDITSQLLCLRNFLCVNNTTSVLDNVKDLTVYLIEHDLASSFHDVFTLCLIFLTIPVTVASAERSFSKLKLIKNYLRNSISQDRLTNIAVLNIEKEKTAELEIDKIINDFANLKSRRKNFLK